jgi:hypothetical protein
MKKSKNMVTILLSVFAVVLMCLCSSCSTDKPYGNPDEIFEELVEAGFFEPPYMLDIAQDRLSEYRINPEDAESFIAKEAAISSIFVQLIIIKANEGKAGDVHRAMLEHQSSLKDDAFYPQGREAAAASIVSRKGNLIYLICDERASEIETVIIKN